MTSPALDQPPEPSTRVRRRNRLTLPVVVLLAAVTTASAGGYGWVRVHQGDTLTEIAAHHHTTVSELVALNHLPGNGDLIIAGSRLRVPHGGHHGAVGQHHHAHHHHAHHHHARHHRKHHRGRGHHRHQRTAGRSHWVVTRYVVRPGDSLYAIAARWHVPQARIARANHLPRSLTVQLGQTLRIGHWTTRPRRHHHARHHSSAITRLEAKLAARSVPSRDHVRLMIARSARRFHINPAFAQAIAWQESGFNQRVVSRVGAIGVMQVVPASGAFVSAYLVHRPLNLLRASDNITAGVGLLSALLSDTHRHRGRAAAGYYQGLASVRANGMFSDTKRYVANVLALQRHFAA